MRLSLALVFAFSSLSAQAAEAPYLFDVLQKPVYRSAWEKLIKLVQPTPDWLLQFAKNFDGASGQMTSLAVEGKPYELYYVCKPGDCEAHRFEIIFDADKHAFGALGGKGSSPAFFGAPSPAVQDAMAKAIKG